ncbi:MAG: hypothetical protein EBR72_00655 [Bacteroidetes bacterium]|nr:hypothetical protein [Bacteroidota bacterium]
MGLFFYICITFESPLVHTVFCSHFNAWLYEKYVPISIPLAEKSGKWLGTGLGSTITFQEPILHRKLFDLHGKYYITLEQNMRLENLSNVISAGIKVNKQEEIF